MLQWSIWQEEAKIPALLLKGTNVIKKSVTHQLFLQRRKNINKE